MGPYCQPSAQSPPTITPAGVPIAPDAPASPLPTSIFANTSSTTSVHRCPSAPPSLPIATALSAFAAT